MKIGLILCLICQILPIYSLNQAKVINIKARADSLYQSGKILQQFQQPDEALINLLEAQQIFEELDAQKELGNTLNRIGLVYGQNWGNWPKAEEYWLQANLIRQKLEDERGIANIANNLAIAYEKMGRYQEAEANYIVALNYRESINDSFRVCGVTKNLGLLKLQEENFYESEQYLKQAQEIAKKNNYSKLYAEIINNFGLLEFSKGAYSTAHRNYIEALELFENQMNAYENSELLNNLGTIYAAYNDTTSARIHYFKALTLCNETGNLDLKARILSNIGSYFYKLNDSKKALEYESTALKIKQEIKNRKGIINSLIDIGNIYFKTGDLINAEKYFQEAKSKSEELGFLYQKAKVANSLVELYLQKSEYLKAADIIDEGLNIAGKLDNPVLLYKLQSKKAKVLEAQSDFEEAIIAYEESIENIERIRSGIGLEEHRSSFMTNALDVYRDMIELLIAQNEFESAYEYYERMKNRNLLDIMDGAFLVFDEQMTEEEIASQRDLEANLRVINKTISNFSATDNNTRSLDSLVVHQRSIRRELDNLKTNLFFNHPDLKQKMAEGEPISIRDAYQLINVNEAILAYLIMEHKTYCFVLRNLSRRNRYVDVITIDVSEKELIETITELNTRWKPSSFKKLYDVLITPISKQLEGVSQVCIVPDKILNILPFHALKNRETEKYLIEDFTVYYSNSLSVLDELRSIGTSGKEEIIAFGNPDFGKTGITTFRGTLAPLPATEEEVKVISEIYGERSKVFTGNQAIEQNFLDHSPDFGIIHLASHGLYDELNPMYSSVLLTADENNDGYLTAREILKLELNADMVVLSACDTAVGNLKEGEGLIGLSRAFFGALVPSLIASLWPVEDYSTKLLMEEFYQELHSGLRPAKALRNAQLNLMQNPQYTNPYFWAPFIFVGDTE